MADIRIKDLTTTASSTASDDFIAVDGTTNGTRKLNAFSPTFGGNATVTGTLTSNGSFAATGSMVSTYGTAPQLSIAPPGGRPIRFNASLGNISIQANSGGWYLGTQFLGSAGTLRGNIWGAGTDDTLDSINIGDGSFSQWIGASSTKIAIPLTTASTTTTSGALVVGNGTSGGLGVGGSINAGGNVTISGSNGYAVIGGRQWSFRANSSGGSPASGCVIRDDSAAADRLTIDINGNTTVGGTLTSSTNTDSGVLQLNLVNSSTGTSASSLFRFNAGTRTATLQAYNDTHATLAGQLRVGTSNGDIVVIPSGVTAATFGASSTTIGLSPSSTDALFSVTGTGTSGATKVVAHLENNFGTAALNNAAQLRFKIFNNSVGDAEFAAINGITDSVTAGARTTGLSFLTGQQTVGLVERMRISGAGVVSITSSAISSTTSSGALVVSGGVGVAGNTVVGGASFTTGDGSSGPYLASSSVIDHSSGQARFYGRGANTSTRATLGFYSTYSDGTGGITLQTFDVSGNATFGASIKTSAPSGGTAAAWKLGTVASVSPTSPNRTIEVDIGGTIYYIHAKTTNN